MSVTLRNVADVSRVEGFNSIAAVGAEHGYAHLAADHVLPFVGIGMPV